MNANLHQGLQQVLADTYSLMAKTHLYHWNVTGESFMSLHTQFQAQYEALFTAADDIAERIRQLGESVVGGLSAFAATTNIAAPKAQTGQQMLAELVIDHRNMSAALVALANQADELSDRITADLLTVRAADHDKTAWMLSAQLNNHR